MVQKERIMERNGLIKTQLQINQNSIRKFKKKQIDLIKVTFLFIKFVFIKFGIFYNRNLGLLIILFIIEYEIYKLIYILFNKTTHNNKSHYSL